MIRNLIVKKDGRIDINEDLIDIYSYPYSKINEWEPSVKLPEFDSVSKIYLDIETYCRTDDPKGALNPETGEIVLIGLMNEVGKSIIIDCHTIGEANGILKFFQILKKKNPLFLAHFNGFSFDLPFIIGRCEKLGIQHPFWINKERPTTFRTAQIFGQPTVYNSVWLNRGSIAIIDLYHQALAWDFVNRKLTKFSLKQVPLQLGLRKKERLTLSYEEMKRCIESGDLTQLKEYLVYDLEDSKLLGDFLLPDIYYQKRVLPHWNYQSISTGGMGSKWNDVLLTEYKKSGDFIPPTPDPVTKYEGGLVGGRAGLYRNVSKIDVASLYPSIMLQYQICSHKDTHKKTLDILKYLKEERLRLKKLSEDKIGTDEGRLAKQMQGALKVMINSAYGFFGTTMKEFNDYEAAAMVTAYGRAILKKMIEICITTSCTPASWDTDGLYYSGKTLDCNKSALEVIQAAMPQSIKLEYELEALAFYVPPSADKAADDGEGLRKNYIIIKKDGSIKANGKFRKRDKCELEKSFTPGLVKAFLTDEHDQYYRNMVFELMSKTYPIEKLSITRKIKETEKRLVELGIGEKNEIVTIWKAPDKQLIGKRGQVLKKTDVMWTSNPTCIDWNYYINMVKEMYKEFLAVPKY